MKQVGAHIHCVQLGEHIHCVVTPRDKSLGQLNARIQRENEELSHLYKETSGD